MAKQTHSSGSRPRALRRFMWSAGWAYLATALVHLLKQDSLSSDASYYTSGNALTFMSSTRMHTGRRPPMAQSLISSPFSRCKPYGPSRRDRAQDIQTRSATGNREGTPLPKDAVVVVAGAVSLVGKILVPMLHDHGYEVRPVLGPGMDAYSIFGSAVQGYVPDGKSPMPEAEALLIADEVGLEADLVSAFIKQMARKNTLKRVVILSAEKRDIPLIGSKETERQQRETAATEACKEVGVECTIVRTGVMKGGGARADTTHNLGKEHYLKIADSVTSLEEELFDMNQRGISSAEERGIFGEKTPVTSRVTAAAAVKLSLESPCSDRIVNFFSTESKKFPEDEEWLGLFEKADAITA